MAGVELCTLEQVKLQLGLVDDPSSDALISQLITGVSAQILNAICRLDLMPVTEYDEWQRGDGVGCKLYTKHYPITEVTSVSLFGSDLDEWDGVDVTSGWRFVSDPNPENQQYIELIGYYGYGCGCSYAYPWPVCPWPYSCTPNIHIVYSAGYDEPPPALSEAAIELVGFKRGLAIAQASDPTLSQVQMGDYTESYRGGILSAFESPDAALFPASISSVIEQYKRVVV